MAYNVFNTGLEPDPVTVGVAFAGGGVRSFTEICALRHMVDQGLPLTAVAGTSMGAAVAALVATGLPLDRVQEILIESEAGMVEMGLFKPNVRMFFPKSSGAAGFVDANLIRDFFAEVFSTLGINYLSQLKMPAAFVSVDMNSMKPLVFSNNPAWFKGMEEVDFYSKDIPIAQAIAASCAFPLAISAVTLDDYVLVDGGVRLNIPTPLFNRELIDVVVSLSTRSEPRPMGNARSALGIGLRSVDCMSDQLEYFQRSLADISVETPADAEVFDWGKGLSLIDIATAYMGKNPPDYSAYFSVVHEREEDWRLEQEEIRERQALEKIQKEREAAQANRGVFAFFRRLRGKSQ